MEVPKLYAGPTWSYTLGTADANGTVAAVTTGTGRPINVEAQTRHLAFEVVGAGTITAGTLVIEEAFDPTYTGTWSQLGASVDLTALTTGATQVVHFTGVFGAVRARVTVNVTGTGGGVYVRVIGN